ncbi:unnamed protein product [Lactuca virosa]|uniref:Wall-associated receptor kinase galacturonan-binding domain-containing protein n=1 Tax=Lactuca virosa TaxID=75947 RepID=A0AAU9NAD1_9ASTR|nr:unnamed protein product [Lactuca virosa]
MATNIYTYSSPQSRIELVCNNEIAAIILVYSDSISISSNINSNLREAGCKDMCGNVRIPYPFGIGTGCYINKWYAVDCNSSTPYLSAINNLELLSVNFENQIATVNISVISECGDPIRNSSVELGESPFLFSRDDNKFTVEGCGNAVILDQGENLVTRCSTICQNQTTNQRDDCYGVNCCQTTIPYYLKTYTIDTTSLKRQDSGGTGVCGSAFLVDRFSYPAGRFSGQSAIVDNLFVPVSLRWTLRRVDIDQRAYASMTEAHIYLMDANLTQHALLVMVNVLSMKWGASHVILIHLEENHQQLELF